MKPRFLDKLRPKRSRPSYLRDIVSGSVYRISDMRGQTAIADIKTKIDTMRALSRDSQISTALSYYATDSTTPNTNGDVIWAVPIDEDHEEVAEIINELFLRWNINNYARDHILELATIGNLYIPTTMMYRDAVDEHSNVNVSLDINSIEDNDFDIIPAYKIPPEDIVHIWSKGSPIGYIYEMSSEKYSSKYDILPEGACIHFSLGGLMGDYTLDISNSSGDIESYDIQFASPLMENAVQPTQTLNLLEDANVLSSLCRTVKFINVDCGNISDEDEIRASLQDIKDAIEQQLSIDTTSGDAQSFVNPQSPNNLIYLPKLNGVDAISITDLNMANTEETDNGLLTYYQDKKLSVLGVPKEAMNFSSNEGLGGAGSVMSQRSSLYANILQRLSSSYMNGWRSAINTYFIARNLPGFVDQFDLRMQPIVTQLSTINFEKRDAGINQAAALVDLLKNLQVNSPEDYKQALTEVLSEVLPETGSNVMGWHVDLSNESEGGDSDEF